MRAHVIVNRRARHLASTPSRRLMAELKRSRAGVQIHETTSLAELDALARELVSGEGSGSRDAVVVLAGGDGSYMAGVSALVRAAGDRPLPPIALAPGGTVGTVARNWGMPAREASDRYVARLLDAITAGTARSTRRPSLRVRTPRGERVGFIFGAGLVTRFFELYESRGAGGNLAAARIVARVFAGSFVGSGFARSVLAPVPCTVTVDGTRAPFDRVSLLCASVVRDLGLKMRLTYRAGEALDRFHVVATPLGPRALGPQMPLVLAGRPLRGPKIDALSGEVGLRFEEGRGGYVLDGDLFQADEITVQAGPVIDIVG